MPNNEDYLDSLLAQAQQDVAPDSAISRVSELTRQIEAEEANEAAKESIEQSIAEMLENIDLNVADTTDDVVSAVDVPIVESGVEIPVVEAVVTETPATYEPIQVTPISDDPNAKLSADDIAALFASVNSAPAEEPAVEEAPVVEEPIAPVAAAEEISVVEEVATEPVESVEEPTIVEETVADNQVVEEPIIEIPAAPEPIQVTPMSDDPNAKLSADDIAALFASVNSAPAEEPAVEETPVVEEPVAPVEEPQVVEETVADNQVVEEPIIETPAAPEPIQVTPISDDPNAKLSADDIAALFASVNSAPAEEPAVEEAPVVEEPSVEEVPVVVEPPVVEETVAENQVVEEPIIETPTAPEPIQVTPISDDPNAKLSADDIAALFASVNSAPAEEPAVVEAPVVEEPAVEEVPVVEAPPVVEEPITETSAAPEPIQVTPISDDPNAKLSADDIAALFASVNSAPAEEPAVEEAPVVEEPVTEPVETVEEPPVVEETVVETPEAPEPIQVTPISDDPNANLSADDIAALFASANISSPAIAEDDVIVSKDKESLNSDLDLDSILSEVENADLVTEGEASDLLDTEQSLEDLLKQVPPEEESEPGDSSDSLDNLSQAEIEKMLSAASDVTPVEEPQGEMEIDLNDLDSLESLGIFDKDSKLDISAQEDAELNEINSLISNSESDTFSLSEDDDLLNMLTLESKRNAEEEEIKSRKYLEEAPSDEEPKKAKKKKKKGKDKDKDAVSESLLDMGEDKPKKEGLIAKIINFLTASDDDEEEKTSGTESGDNSEGASGENKAILDELDQAGEEKGKQKGKGKKKDKKGKKDKGKASSEDGDGDEESSDSSKKGKPKKEKKVKEKKPQEPDNSKPLNKKNVRRIFILAILILVLIIITVKFIPGMQTAKDARQAYYKEDYQKAYTELYGQKLSASDQLIFDRSKTILRVENKYSAFCAFNKMGMKAEALDQLLQAVDKYEVWLIDAETYDCVEGYNKAFDTVKTALDVTYDLSVERAKEINALPTNLEYSLMVDSIVNHTEYIDPNQPLPQPFVPEVEKEYEDMLPEEGM